MHFNPHKTFSGPHGGGGPGAGPIAVRKHLAPYLPAPLVARDDDGTIASTTTGRSRSAGSAPSSATSACSSAPTATSGAGPDGLKAVAEHAVLNANYLMALLRDVYPARSTSSACTSSSPRRARPEARSRRPRHGRGQAADRLQHPRTHGLLPADRPRGPDDRADRDGEPRDARRLRRGHAGDRREAGEDPEAVKAAPHDPPVGRLDEVRAAKQPVVRFAFEQHVHPEGAGGRQLEAQKGA